MEQVLMVLEEELYLPSDLGWLPAVDAASMEV
jgi:hypothetical protein